MERINPHYRIYKPFYYLKSPEECIYYFNGQCDDEACTPDSCKTYARLTQSQIITLCGSTRFKEFFFEAARDLTLQGWIVLMPGVFGHSGDQISDEEKQNLDELHLEKIRMSNAILVLNIGGYTGESTQKEMDFARSHNIPIYKYE